MDVAESFCSSVFVFWNKAYKSTSLTELITKLENYKRIQEENADFIEGYPSPCFWFLTSLENEMRSYEKELFSYNDKFEHFHMINRIDLLCEKYELFLRDLTITNYKKNCDYMLPAPYHKIKNERILVVWYLTTLILKINLRGCSMHDYFFEKVKYLQHN